MSREASEELEVLFEELVALSPPARMRRLAELGALDPESAAELESLFAAREAFAAREKGENFLSERAVSSVPELSAILAQLVGREAPGEESFRELLANLSSPRRGLERYEDRGEIGRGGMGVVRRALDPDLMREVAVKLVHTEEEAPAETPVVAARTLRLFLKEARVTGGLDHPGIVPVHQLGVDERGSVFFTMRLVRGRELGLIFALAREGREGWALPRALEVLLKVCDALAYAHSCGVVHRDLKPENVLVGRYGEVYVMDWGVAHVSGAPDLHDLRPRSSESERAKPADLRLVTEDGTVMGTPAYMAPEQARGETPHVDERTDVYAIGALLYQLLAGHPPYLPADERVPARELLARVCAGPPAPLAALGRRLPAELEAICEKAMARDPDARYPSAAELASDLRAFLDERVVRAHRTGPWAELRKWMRRNRSLAASLAAALVFLVGGLASTAWVEAAGRARESKLSGDLSTRNVTLEERNRELADAVAALERSESEARASAESARREQARAEGIVDFMVELFESPDPNYTLGEELLAEEVLRRGVEKIRSRLEREPLVRAALLDAMGRALRILGSFGQAASVLEESLALRSAEQGENHGDTNKTKSELVAAYELLGRYGEAEELALAVRRSCETELGPEHPQTLSALANLASVFTSQARFEEAFVLRERVLSVCDRKLASDDPVRLNALEDLGDLLLPMGRYEEALARFEDVLEEQRLKHEEHHPDVLRVLNLMVTVYWSQGRYSEAEPLAWQVLDGHERVFGPDHPFTLNALNSVALLAHEQHRYGEAEELFRQALEEHERVLGRGHPMTLGCRNNLATLFKYVGRLGEARSLLEESLAAAEERLAEGHPTRLTVRMNLATLPISSGELEESLVQYGRLIEDCRKHLGSKHTLTLTALNNVGLLLKDVGRYAEALPFLEEARAGLVAAIGADKPNTLGTTENLVQAYLALGHAQNALPLARELVDLTPKDDPTRARRWATLERVLTEIGSEEQR